MIVYRLTSTRYAHDLSGRGAEMAGGRWNTKGVALLYTSQSRALSMLEVAVHLSFSNKPIHYSIVSIELPEVPFVECHASILSPHWKAWPPHPSTQMIGDLFVKEGKHLILKVPSVLVPEEYNYLVNPKHKDATTLKIIAIEPFTFDTRFYKP